MKPTVPADVPQEPTGLRKWEDRTRLAAYISQHLFSISPRTIEAWPLQWAIVHKRALARTDEALNYAKNIMRAAEKEAVRGGSSKRNDTKEAA